MKYYIFLAVALLTCPIVQPAYAETDSASYPDDAYGKKIIFDPAKCSQDPHGMTYVAIGKTVFRHSSHHVYSLSGSAHSSDITEPLYTAPHSFEPAGCPGNPVQTLGAGYRLYFPDLIESPEPFRRIDINYTSQDIDKYEYNLNNEKEFDDLCSSPNHTTDTSISNLKICKIIQDRYTAVLAFQSANYLTPRGRKFTGECYQSGFKASTRCAIVYNIKDHIRIGYLFPVDESLIKSTIESDKTIRQKLQAEEVQNYPWAISATDKSKEK